MRAVVTGAAGFIGSHLCESLLRAGHDVVGLDCFIPYYARELKEQNLAVARSYERFRFIELDLRTDSIGAHVCDAHVVFHLAAMAGLLRSWTDFETYWTCNALATQRLVEAVARSNAKLERFILVSTSSVYGRFAIGDESMPTQPVSPYGVTKLASEHLCRAHAEVSSLPLVVLRYFSIYGPRQRPDMGYYQFIRSLVRDDEITVTGDGHQVRGNTYIDDCIAATVAAVNAVPGETFNVGGGESASVWDILARLERLSGKKARVRQVPNRPGDQRHTFADTGKLRRHLGWEPQVGLEEGLKKQWEWQLGQK